MTTDAQNWWRASATEWLKAAGVMAGGLATAVVLVIAIANLMAML